MKHYRPGLPTEEVMAGLRDAIRRSDQASVHIVLWLSDVIERDLYRERGCLSPHQFVREKCGFSASRAAQVLRLARLSAEYPMVRDALASGRLGWTNLRVLAPILSRENVTRWVGIACGISRRELERRIATARSRSRDAVREAKGEPVQLRVTGGAKAGPIDSSDSRGGGGSEPSVPDAPGCTCSPPHRTAHEDHEPDAPVSVPDLASTGDETLTTPVTVTLRLDPLQMARLEVLIDQLRRRGHRGSREEVLLAALELAAEGPGKASTASSFRAPRSRYQIVVAECPGCREKRVAASDRPIDPATAAAVACDAERVDDRGRRRSAIPPSVRRRVLARDGHRCRTPGCGRRTLLELHHRVPVARGGTNHASNLVTSCHGCHQALHAMPGADSPAPGYRLDPSIARDEGVVRDAHLDARTTHAHVTTAGYEPARIMPGAIRTALEGGQRIPSA